MVEQTMKFSKEEFKEYMMSTAPNIKNVEITKSGEVILTFDIDPKKLSDITNRGLRTDQPMHQ